MTVGDGVAIYAALVGTASLSWQVLRARRSDRPGITVKLSNAMLGYPNGAVWAVQVRAINRGTRPVAISGAGLELQDGSGRTFVSLGRQALDTIPGVVEPHGAINCFLGVAELERQGFNLTRPLVGFVNLETGETVRSAPTTLRK